MNNNPTEIFRPYKFDKILFFTVLLLIIIGIIMVFSSSGIISSEKYQHPFHFLTNHILGVFIGVFLILLILPIKRQFYKNSVIIFTLVLLSGALLGLCLIMPEIAHTKRWIQFLGLGFQPSELAKISVVLFLAYYIDRKKEKLNEFKVLIFPLLILLSFTVLILLEPDYGTAILIILISMITLFIGGLKFRYFLHSGIIFVGLFIFYLFKASYRIDRILAFIFPSQDPLNSGFQIIQSKIAIGSGGILGVSIGESTQKLFYLPCAHTDYIFAIVGEELGLVGSALILLLFFVFLWRGLAISRKAPNLFCKIAAAGLTISIFFQAMLNMSIVMGLGPPTGIPLPFISYGRSSLICTLLATGIILNISQRREGSRVKK